MLLGGLWCLNEYYAWMSLRSYSVEANDPALEKRFWEFFPAEGLRFWPVLIYRAQSISDFLEKAIPVVVRTTMTGYGTFSTKIDLLSPWLLLEWRGQIWCLSREGRMWNTADASLQVGGMKIPAKPLWRVASLAASPVSADERPLPGGVFPSLFPVDVIKEFLAEFEKENWFRDVQEIVLDRRAGADLFRLRFVRGAQEFRILIQEDKYGWQELSIALDHIMNRLLKEGGNHLIDATYANKIIVRNLSAAAGEGSLK